MEGGPLSEADHREQHVELATGRVRVLRGGAGDALVVLHHSTGNPGWIPFYEQLARSFDVVVPDMPGYGGSERPEWARDPRDLALLIGRTLDRLGLGRVALVGLGLGGFVAAELACQNPARLSSLVLIGAAGLQPEDGEILDQMMVGHREYMLLGFRDEEAHHAVFGEEPADELQQLWDFSREMTARISWKPYMFNRRLVPLLPDVQVPALVLWGEHDRIVPRSCGEQYARLLPAAELQVIQGAGHLVELEQPEEIARRVTEHARKAPQRTT